MKIKSISTCLWLKNSLFHFFFFFTAESLDTRKGQNTTFKLHFRKYLKRINLHLKKVEIFSQHWRFSFTCFRKIKLKDEITDKNSSMGWRSLQCASVCFTKRWRQLHFSVWSMSLAFVYLRRVKGLNNSVKAFKMNVCSGFVYICRWLW